MNTNTSAANFRNALPQGMCRLPDWGLLQATGAEARKFLHGQLTQDVEHLQPTAARLAGYCSAKGRLLATLLVWSGDEDSVWLAGSADLLPATLKRLSMFVMRAKCKLSDASAQRPMWGLAGPVVASRWSAAVGLPVWGRCTLAEGDLIRLPDAVHGGLAWPRYLLVSAVLGDSALADAAFAGLPSLDQGDWDWLEVMSGVPRICLATQEQFVPQMVNLELVGGVNFQKGCYPGQEVVARSQYRGTTKRRAQVMTSTAPLQPAQEIFHSDDAEQPAGRVILAGSSFAQGHAALVEVRLAALESGTLSVGAVGGPVLQLAPLPYALLLPE